MSADGAALQRLPPTVARFLTCTDPMRAPLSASAVYPARTRLSSSSARAVTAAPTLSPPLSDCRLLSGATPLRSTTQTGFSRPFLSCGKRSVPPATSFASVPRSPSTRRHSSTVPGNTISNRRKAVSPGCAGQEVPCQAPHGGYHARRLADCPAGPPSLVDPVVSVSREGSPPSDTQTTSPSLSCAARVVRLHGNLLGGQPHNAPLAPHRDRIAEPLVAQQRFPHRVTHGLQDARQVFDTIERCQVGIASCGHTCLSRTFAQAARSRTCASLPAPPVAINRGSLATAFRRRTVAP